MSRTATDLDVRLDELFRGLPATPAPKRRVPRPRVDLRPRPVRGGLRFARSLAISFVLAIVTALLVGLTIPALFGFHNFTVMSGSMEPTIHTGDVVVDQQISPLDARIGDIVTFRDPQNHSKLITHRVRRIEVRGGVVSFATKGDASNTVQRWSVPATGHIGRVVLHLWKLGYLLWWVSQPWGRLLLVVIPVLALGVYEIKRIWAPAPKESARELAP